MSKVYNLIVYNNNYLLGQEQLRDKSVLVIGAGGLGSPVILYLAAAGVGQLGICDYDTISIDNLHRQIIHNETGIGCTKIDSAIDCVRRLVICRINN